MTSNKLDIYQQFIKSCLEKRYSKKTKLYKHRIIPGFEQGTYTPSNILWCSYKDHCLAHFYRFLSYRKKEDLLAWKLMTNQSEQKFCLAGQLGGVAVQKIQKEKQSHFYNPDSNIQKFANFKRWGIVIENKRFEYTQLNIIFIKFYKAYFLNSKIQKFTIQDYKQICGLQIPQIFQNKGQKLYKKICFNLEQQKNLVNNPTYKARLAAFHRHGIKIENKRVAFKELPPCFVNYHKKYHLTERKLNYTKKEYKQICNLSLSELEKKASLDLAKKSSLNLFHIKTTSEKKKPTRKASFYGRVRAFHRYGIIVEGHRIAFNHLHSTFVEFHEIFFLAPSNSLKKKNIQKMSTIQFALYP